MISLTLVFQLLRDIAMVTRVWGPICYTAVPYIQFIGIPKQIGGLLCRCMH